ncbi:trigger factor [Flavobacteriaceae bacterium UJ101]|nr:trigger factor [Flavobacteriaceae bacterium UJ101]
MNITKTNIDDLNAIVAVTISQDDYQEKVDATLKSYKKNANVPGFRKGHVPMGMIKKQYGKAVMFDEVNRLLQESVSNYINEEKLNILGQPLPKPQDSIDWDAKEFTFEFELGLAPEFDVKLDGKGITQYEITVDDKEINRYIENFQTRYGKMISQDEVKETSNVNGIFEELEEDGKPKEEGIKNQTTISVSSIKGKKNKEKLVGSKIEDELEFKTKNLFENTSDLALALGKTVSEVEGLEIKVRFIVKEITEVEPAEINQELFDKIYGEGTVDSEKAFKEKIADESTKMYQGEVDRQLLNDVIENLIEKTKFDLPGDFLTRWLKETNEKVESDEQAKEEYEKAEKSLRYQLIEAKVAEKYEVKVEMEDIKAEAANLIKAQMAQFGQANASDEEVEEIVNRVLQNQDEYKRVAEQVFGAKMLNVYKDNMKFKSKKVNFEDFVKEVTEKQAK